jgi:hypothetical protein
MWITVRAKIDSLVIKCNECPLKFQMLSSVNENYMYISTRQIYRFPYSSSFYWKKLLHNELTVKRVFEYKYSCQWQITTKNHSWDLCLAAGYFGSSIMYQVSSNLYLTSKFVVSYLLLMCLFMVLYKMVPLIVY